ncbi:hypothetical protein NR798_14150 [Archangium gephyra]|uniref:hypothetical protein n=1 Tax=Archangium gephyra TaxID=48 RepID=UPI0035D52925
MIVAGLLLLPTQAVLAQQKQCIEAEARVKGDSLEACATGATRLLDERLLGTCVQAPEWKALVAGRLAECTRRVMNERLDVRLLALKKADRKQFSAEMKLQKLYNQSIQEQCALYEACGGPSGARLASECRDRFQRYRAGQAVPINEDELTLGDELPQTDAPPLRQQFAEALCALPKKVWAKGKVPDNCVPRALAELEQAVGPFQPEPCPRFECAAGRRIRLDLKPWEEQPDAPPPDEPSPEAAESTRVRRLLQKLGEEPGDKACLADMVPSVSLGEAALVRPDTTDRLIRVDFSCDGFPTSLLVALHPLGEGEWCKLGSLGAEGRGFGGCAASNPLAYESVHLTDGDRETLQVTSRQSHSALREDGNRECWESAHTAFYDVRGSELVPVFGSNGEARIIPEGPYPRALIAPGEDLKDTVYRFRDGEYVPAPRTSP